MTRFWKRWARLTLPVVLASALFFAAPAPRPALAQPGMPGEEAATEESKGRPLDGYLATITLMLLALFIVGKSARR